LIDTPGFDDTYRTDTDVLRSVAQWLNSAYKADIKLTGIIYLHRISDTRVGNSAFRSLRMFKKLCGDDGLGSVVLATTMWGKNKAAENEREKELQTRPDFWKHMIAKGSKVFRHDSGRKSAAEIIDYLINKKRPVTLDIQKEMIDKKMKLVNTGAGAEVATEVEKRKQKWAEELEGIKKELREAIEQKDSEMKKELQEVKRDLQNKLAQDQESMRKLQADSDQLHQQIRERYEEQFKELRDVIQTKDKLLEEAQKEASQIRRMNDNELEIERLKMQMKLKEQYYKMVYATRCVVM
jgi:flagellar biosynthesis GTPase FlhF